MYWRATFGGAALSTVRSAQPEHAANRIDRQPQGEPRCPPIGHAYQSVSKVTLRESGALSVCLKGSRAVHLSVQLTEHCSPQMPPRHRGVVAALG